MDLVKEDYTDITTMAMPHKQTHIPRHTICRNLGIGNADGGQVKNREFRLKYEKRS